MAIKRGDRVVIAGKRTDTDYGRVATVNWANDRVVDVNVDGSNITYDRSKISTLPDSLIDSDTESRYYWCVDVEFNSKHDTPMELAFDSQPTVNWGNGMIRIDGDDEMHLYPISDIAHVMVCRKPQP